MLRTFRKLFLESTITEKEIKDSLEESFRNPRSALYKGRSTVELILPIDKIAGIYAIAIKIDNSHKFDDNQDEFSLFHIIKKWNNKLECKKYKTHLSLPLYGVFSRIKIKNFFVIERFKDYEFYQATLTGFHLKISIKQIPGASEIYSIPNTSLFLMRVRNNCKFKRRFSTLKLYHFDVDGLVIRELTTITDRVYNIERGDEYQPCVTLDGRIITPVHPAEDSPHDRYGYGSFGGVCIFDLKTTSSDVIYDKNLASLYEKKPFINYEENLSRSFSKSLLISNSLLSNWEKRKATFMLENWLQSSSSEFQSILPKSLIDIITSYACPKLEYTPDMIPIREITPEQIKSVEPINEKIKAFKKKIQSCKESKEKHSLETILNHLSIQLLLQGEKTYTQIVKEIERMLPHVSTLTESSSSSSTSVYHVDYETLRNILDQLLNLDRNLYQSFQEEKEEKKENLAIESKLKI